MSGRYFPPVDLCWALLPVPAVRTAPFGPALFLVIRCRGGPLESCSARACQFSPPSLGCPAGLIRVLLASGVLGSIGRIRTLVVFPAGVLPHRGRHVGLVGADDSQGSDSRQVPAVDPGSAGGWGPSGTLDVVYPRDAGQAAPLRVFSLITGGMFFVIDHLWCLWDVRRQTLHDKMCGSIVICCGGSVSSGSPGPGLPDPGEGSVPGFVSREVLP